jgi:uncharacterized membrane protein (DUF485 family)
MIFLAVLVWILNLAISTWNAYAVGKAWVETKHYGGWPRFLAWMGAIMSASGFTWCYLLLLAVIAYWVEWLNASQIEVMINLGYVLLIPGILLSGLAITVDSWARAYRERTLASAGTAAYNTFAQIYNIYNAVNNFGRAFRSVTRFFGGGDSRDREERDGGGAAVLVVILVLLALLGGILTTAAIIHRVAGSGPKLSELDRPPER